VTEPIQIPPKPTDTSESGWILWANKHFPRDSRWVAWLQKRPEGERPEFGTAQSLEDLRGQPSRRQAGELARLWWTTKENIPRIHAAHAAQKREDQRKERKRLILLAKQALDGHLGDSASVRDDARSTAQTYLRQAPEQCSDDDLSDWMLMHQHCKALSSGKNPPRPKLARDVRAEEAQRQSLYDIEQSIDATPAAKPRAVRQGEIWG
jgi:hypothetical protein